jgi:hypothetical protein
MAVLGVITCEILELEFAYVLARDPDICHLTILENAYALGMIEALEAQDVSPRRIPILRGFSPAQPDRLEVLVRVLELALHFRKHTLQQGLVKAARDMGRYVDAIVLGYGLCGNALQKPEELLVDAGVPVFIPMDQDHPVDDCVGLLIGGRQCYYQEQCRVAGTFFMIPGWTRHWKELFQKEYGSFDVEFARRIFGMSNYERSLLIPNPTLSVTELRRNIEEFNQLFGFRTELKQGNLELLKKTWEKAKQYLQENNETP